MVLVIHRPGVGHEVAADRRSTPLAHRASARRSTPTSPRPTTTARRSRATPATYSPTHRATSAPTASRSPTIMGGLAMLLGRFVPILAVLAVAGGAGAQEGRTGGPGNDAHRHADVRLPAGRRRGADRRPDVPAAPSCWARSSSPHDPTLLRPCARTSSAARWWSSSSRCCSGSSTAGHDRDRPGGVPRQGRRQPLIRTDSKVTGSTLLASDVKGRPRTSTRGHRPPATAPRSPTSATTAPIRTRRCTSTRGRTSRLPRCRAALCRA